MSNEIKEILDKMKNYSGECHSILAYSICGYKKKIRGDFRMCMNDIDLLLDYITNLQQEKDYLDDYNRHLHNENERLNNIINELENELSKLCEYYYDGMPKALCKHLLDVLKELKDDSNLPTN